MRNSVDEVGLQALALAKLRVLFLQLRARALEALGHLVETTGELADFPRATMLEAERQLAARKAACSCRRVANGPRDRARQVEPEEEHEGGRAGQPRYSKLDRVPGLGFGGALPPGCERILGCAKVLEAHTDVVDPLLALGLRRRGPGGSEVREEHDVLGVFGEVAPDRGRQTVSGALLARLPRGELLD